MEISPREQELIADVLISLMRQAELDLRQALSERLCVLDEVPLRLVLEMANDDISVASPVLKKSDVLGDLDLIYIIKSKTPEYWQAIAKRKSMSGQVMEILAKTKDVPTALNLLKNEKIEMNEGVMNILVDMTAQNKVMETPLLRREELDEKLVQKLYQIAGDALKENVAQRFGDLNFDAENVVEDIVLEFVEAAPKMVKKQVKPQPDQKLVQYAKNLKNRGLLNANLMITALKRGQYEMFIVLMSEFSDLDLDIIQKALKQKNGQSLATICKAGDIVKSDFSNIFLLTNRFRSETKTVDSAAYGRAVQYYDRITSDMARKLLNSSMRVH